VAKAFGAKTVVGIARDPEKLQRALQFGADYIISSANKDENAVRNDFRDLCKAHGLPNYGWIIFEVTGTGPGQGLRDAAQGHGGNRLGGEEEDRLPGRKVAPPGGRSWTRRSSRLITLFKFLTEKCDPPTPFSKGGLGGFCRRMPGKQCQLSSDVYYSKGGGEITIL
jgi:hypothetical protein